MTKHRAPFSGAPPGDRGRADRPRHSRPSPGVADAEIERVRRYHPIGLTMLEVDDLTPSTTYAHVQGDAVLRHLARVLQENSRDADSPARYGGEELSPMLPHTDLDGTDAIGERIRTIVDGLPVPRTAGQSVLRITASLGSPTRPTETSRC